ncbi:MAG: NAD(P)-dependent oxidoreductase [Acidobacteriota bacterium]|nr:NAD(P)-dependent oxidoreductase [Acidobacteriota bacterium]
MMQHHGHAAPERVVLIGARGFIPLALRRELDARGIPALAVGSADIDLTAAGAGEALGSRLQPSDAVVMLAALTPDRGRDIATLMRNLAMMRSVCAALQMVRCSHLLYFSSDAVYDPAVTRVGPATSPAPADLYGAMHLTREIMARSLTDIPLAILRVTGVYGAGDPHNSYGPNRFRRMAATSGSITLFGGGEEKRDHVYLGDVARFAAACLERRSTGVIDVATGVSTTFKDVAQMVAGQFPEAIAIVETPRGNPVTHRHYDGTALIKAFPEFRFTPLEQGLARVTREESAAHG